MAFPVSEEIILRPPIGRRGPPHNSLISSGACMLRTANLLATSGRVAPLVSSKETVPKMGEFWIFGGKWFSLAQF